MEDDKVNILLVDDQPAKLLSYEVILSELGQNLIAANSAREALQHLLKTDVAIVLIDVYMPDIDGFELARMIREHPRFQETAIIFISAVMQTDLDFLRGYEYGAVDYMPVPVVPEILRAKVKAFAELHRKTRQLERLNHELEKRVAERTEALEASTEELRRSEQRLRLAFDAAQMGWWDYDFASGQVTWSPSMERIMGGSAAAFGGTLESISALVHPDDRQKFLDLVTNGASGQDELPCELRFVRADGQIRWSLTAGQVLRDAQGRQLQFAGVDLDITARKQAEESERLLTREVDHRAKNLLAVVQSILRLSRASTTPAFVAAVEGRIQALARAHSLLSETRWQSVNLSRIVEEEMAPYSSGQTRRVQISATEIHLPPASAQSIGLVLHELATNAAKYGALSVPQGTVAIRWTLESEALVLQWSESGGPPADPPTHRGFGTDVIGSGIEHQLGGKTDFDWRPEGLRCTLTIPADRVRTVPPGAAAGQRAEQKKTIRLLDALSKRQVMIVEDEALIAMMMRDVLKDLGLGVIGPFGTIEEAMTAIRTESLHAAILDINIGKHPVYPVADILMNRGVPFVFITGYASTTIDSRFAHVPTLEKPVNRQALTELFTQVAPLAS